MTYTHNPNGQITDTLATVTNKQAIVTARTTAGAAYVTAVQALMTARVELAAHDLASRSGLMHSSVMLRHSAGFAMEGNFALDFPMHLEFMRELPSSGDISGRAYTRHRQLVAALDGSLSASNTLLSARTTAGATYATALSNFIAAWIELNGCDIAVASSVFQTLVDSGTQSFQYRATGAFNRGPEMMSLTHTEFAPQTAFQNERQIAAAGLARGKQLLNTMQTVQMT